MAGALDALAQAANGYAGAVSIVSLGLTLEESVSLYSEAAGLYGWRYCPKALELIYGSTEAGQPIEEQPTEAVAAASVLDALDTVPLPVEGGVPASFDVPAGPTTAFDYSPGVVLATPDVPGEPLEPVSAFGAEILTP